VGEILRDLIAPAASGRVAWCHTVIRQAFSLRGFAANVIRLAGIQRRIARSLLFSQRLKITKLDVYLFQR
jgi:hypothetical protein